MTSVAVIGLSIAYVLPTLLRLLQGDRFQPGPWHLGRWSRPIGIIAIAWVAFITVLFMLPQVSPVSGSTFNYTPLAVLVVLGFAAIYWFVSAPALVHRPQDPPRRNWPRSNTTSTRSDRQLSAACRALAQQAVSLVHRVGHRCPGTFVPP